MNLNFIERIGVFNKTNGMCHLCKKLIILSDYGKIESPYGWEYDHFLPVSFGGKNNLGNLYPAHISCNRSRKNKLIFPWLY